MRRGQFRPEWWAAIGVVVVAVDLRAGSLDLLADPLGWGLVSLAAWSIGLRSCAALAGVAGALSIAEVWVPHRYVLLDRESGEVVDVCRSGLGCSEVLRFDPIAPLHAVIVAVAVATGTVAVIWMASQLAPRIEGRRRAVLRRRVVAVCAAYVVLWDLPLVLAALGPALRGLHYDIVWDGPGAAERLAVVGIVAALGMAAALATLASTTQLGHDTSEGWWGTGERPAAGR